MTEKERFTVDGDGKYWDKINHKYVNLDYLFWLVEELDNRITELETRNKRQYERLKELTDLMFNRDWKTLENMVDEWEKEEKQLQKYGG